LNLSGYATWWYRLKRLIDGKEGMRLITCILPKPQVQASQFQLNISYFLQKCKKGKLPKKDLPLLENDITTIFYRYDTCDLLQIVQILIFHIRVLINSKASSLLSPVFFFHFLKQPQKLH
jgi:hypothetical protein